MTLWSLLQPERMKVDRYIKKKKKNIDLKSLFMVEPCWEKPENSVKVDNDDAGWVDHSLKCKWLCGFCFSRSDGFLLNSLKVQPDHFQQIRKVKI